jgi:hypothetical protein
LTAARHLQATDQPGASHEVVSPTALSGHAALTRGCRPSGRSRFGVGIRQPPWRSPQQPSDARPCGFPHGSRVRPTPALISSRDRLSSQGMHRHFPLEGDVPLPADEPAWLGRAIRPRRRSWGCALRSLAPAYRCPSVFRLSEPTCRWSERPSRSFSPGDRPLCTAAQYTHRNRTARSRTSRVGSWALPLPAIRAAIAHRAHGGRYCLGLCPLSGLRTSAYGCAQATLDRCLGHQPPDTASGSFPLLGFSGANSSEMNGTVCCCRALP